MSTTNNGFETNNINPWKGLNFYREGEILYGRDSEIQSIALYVINNIQTVLYGKSGIGKSSIINAGVFPIARKSGLFPISVRLKHDEETVYLEQIKTAFKESGIGITELLAPVDKSRETLWEFLHRNIFYDTNANNIVRPLIVFDQFEEIFTLQHDEKKIVSFFAELADLLNEVTPKYITDRINSKYVKDRSLSTDNSDNVFTFDFGVEDSIGGEAKNQYVSDSLFNVVFIIREDFLSYLERYTKYIPIMKYNRYALLPINEEQAKDIIMKPIEGLVDVDVAKLIIQKVTGRTDFDLDNFPEIEVDAAVLSLFLSRLYEMKGDKLQTITASLVVDSSKDIIKDFYIDSISDLPQSDIEKLEDQLLTYEGRRDNVSYNDLVREGVSKDVLDILIEERKLLRKFNYQNDIRVELVHDILCPIVNERIKHREQIAKEKAREEKEKKVLAEQELLRKKNSRRKKIIGLLSVILFIAGILIVVLKIANQNLRDENGYGSGQQFVISFCEDSLVIADNDYWKATLRVIAISDSSESCLIDTLINKSIVSNLYSFASKTAKRFKVSVDFGDNSRYENINRTFTIGELTSLKESEPSVLLKIQYANRQSHSYESSVVMDYDGNLISIQDAVVILMDKVQRTDDKGHFCFKMENPIKSDAAFYVVKDGFNVERITLSSDGKLKDQYVLTPSDSLSWFYQEIKKWDTVTRWEYEFEKEIVFTNGEKDRLHFRGKYIKRLDDKYEIEGYYYYQSEYNKFEKSSKGNHSYYFFKGVIDQKSKIDDPYRYYEVMSSNIASNRQTLIGKMKEKEKGTLRDYSGEIKTSSGFIGSYGK